MPENALLFIHALTGLHPGSGTALGTVDLPVQRERHTQWPTIPGSSLKGILRDACRRKTAKKAKEADADEEVSAVFGPPTTDADAHAGALSLTDARILAFPVRSLRGVFAWVTCPDVLERLQRDLTLAGTNGWESKIPALDKEQAACDAGSPLLVDGNKLVLEEFEFTRIQADVTPIAEWVSTAVTDSATAARIKTHLVILYNDDFTHFVRHATEVVARIGLDYERKTVKTGALFYAEFLPPETLFYSVVLADDSRRKRKDGDKEIKASDVLRYVRERMNPVLQIGGDETIGKGLCAVRLSNGKEA
ncbi:MAG: type III-B CRISPR module RAMP protein Cmr4 [Planctomycetes bacterium]|nr:type III-B CRISPR module RAMP protein Cmr4 [Planctomycetota bacterium]